MERVPFSLILPLIKTEFLFKKVVHFGHDRERERRSEIESPCLVNSARSGFDERSNDEAISRQKPLFVRFPMPSFLLVPIPALQNGELVKP